MQPKYYYYASKNKIEMLEAQFEKWDVSKISPKLELAGVSIGTDIEVKDNSHLIKRLSRLIKIMNHKKIIQSLSQGEIEAKIFGFGYYQEESDWHNGLVSFGSEVSYVLWKLWNDYIILLVGSPAHILGERFVTESNERPFPMMTPRLIERLYFLADSVHDNSVQAQRLSEEGKNKTFFLEEEKIKSDSPIILASQEANPLGLGILCTQHLRNMPQSKIDTVFTLFKKYTFVRPDDLPIWIKSLQNYSDETIRGKLEKCKGVFTGSPIYTAFV
jgi:hypothetical protein